MLGYPLSGLGNYGIAVKEGACCFRKSSRPSRRETGKGFALVTIQDAQSSGFVNVTITGMVSRSVRNKSRNDLRCFKVRRISPRTVLGERKEIDKALPGGLIMADKE